MRKHLKLSIDKLLLDKKNPRLDSAQSQLIALEKIIHLNVSHFRNLMTSIKEDGLDPGDEMYIIQSKDKFVVLDGNRRLSALRVLNDPNILDRIEISTTTKKSLVSAADGFDRNIAKSVRCIKFDRRKDANEWIERRHTGEAKGEGRIRWGSLDIQRFTGDYSILDIMEFIKRNAGYSDDEWKKIESVIKRQSTTLARLLGSAPGQEHLSITFSHEKGEIIPKLRSRPKWALKVLCKIIKDIRDGNINSRTLNKASDIEDYFAELPKDLQPQKTTLSRLQSFKDIHIKERSPSSSEPIDEPITTGVPPLRKTLAPKKHQFKPPESEKGRGLLREAGNLNVHKLTISATFVLRSFIEFAINDYMESNKISRTEKGNNGAMFHLSLTQKADRVIKHIIEKDPTQKNQLRGFRNKILGNNSLTSIQSLNDFIHQKFQIPAAANLIPGWEASVPLFIAIYGKPDA